MEKNGLYIFGEGSREYIRPKEYVRLYFGTKTSYLVRPNFDATSVITHLNDKTVTGPNLELFGTPDNISQITDFNDITPFRKNKNNLTIDDKVWFKNISGTIPNKEGFGYISENSPENNEFDYKYIYNLGRLAFYERVVVDIKKSKKKHIQRNLKISAENILTFKELSEEQQAKLFAEALRDNPGKPISDIINKLKRGTYDRKIRV